MSRKHNVKHRRGKSNYPKKVAEGKCGGRMSDPLLDDGKRSSSVRGGTGK